VRGWKVEEEEKQVKWKRWDRLKEGTA